MLWQLFPKQCDTVAVLEKCKNQQSWITAAMMAQNAEFFAQVNLVFFFFNLKILFPIVGFSLPLQVT
jgi:hypothetical protein